MDINTEIFLIRHGEGIHNRPDYDHSEDPELTALGYFQARACANALFQHMQENDYFNRNNNINIFLFSSVLYRTQETVSKISLELQQYFYENNIPINLPQHIYGNNISINLPQNIYVIPCSNEINKPLTAYINNSFFKGNCDDNTITSRFIPAENKCSSFGDSDKPCKIDVNNHKIIWDNVDKYKCSSDSTFIELDLKIYSDIKKK
jgi:hypothetical protein